MKRFLTRTTLPLFFFIYCISTAFANVSLPAIFGNHMVLQQNAEVTIWGWSKPLEEITVRGSWDEKSVKIKVGNHGNWQVKLHTPGAGGPYTVTVQGYNKVIIEDVLIGEVWLCSGQSNMEWTVNIGIENGEQHATEANHPQIRFFTVLHRAATTPQLDLDGEWVVCTPETMRNFSAIGYFFGNALQQNLGAPIGLINSSWGGTPAEIWTEPTAIAQDKILADAATKLPDAPWGPKEPGSAYLAMIQPLIPFQIAGALWYQGEANTANGATYNQLLTTMVKTWRAAWGYEFPFYYVQIAPFKYGRAMEGVLVRDAQRQATQSIPNSGMVVISDIGNTENIHPKNKIDVGIRLANWALHYTYGKKDVVASGPMYRNRTIEKNKIRLFFDYAEQGLMTKGKELTYFEIAGEDQQFVPAQARIEGNTVIVQAKTVKNPVAVRFAWSNTAEPNLFNKAGLPTSCFRTDDWEIVLK